MSQLRPALNLSIQPTAHILGVRVDALDPPGVLRRAHELMMGEKPALLVTANALLAMDVSSDPALEEACRAAELVTADGVGLVWAARHLGQARLTRLPGVDLALQLCLEAARHGQSVFLLGAAPGVADAAARGLRLKVPGLAVTGTHDGFFKDSEESGVLGAIAASGARLVLVALGSPRQERWIHRHRSELAPALYMGVGGSFDIWAGRLRRAPAMIQRLGLEWLFRLLQEPSRYGRMLRLPVFAWRVERARRRAK